jgi:cytochrome c biogenesis protein CcdA
VTRAELRQGLRRLLFVVLGLVALVVALSAGFVAFGATARNGVSAGAGSVGLLLVLVGVGAFSRTQPVRRGSGGFHIVDRSERRDAEALTGGLLGLGVLFCVLSLGIG